MKVDFDKTRALRKRTFVLVHHFVRGRLRGMQIAEVLDETNAARPVVRVWVHAKKRFAAPEMIAREIHMGTPAWTDTRFAAIAKDINAERSVAKREAKESIVKKHRIDRFASDVRVIVEDLRELRARVRSAKKRLAMARKQLAAAKSKKE